MSENEQWYYDSATGEVSQGKQEGFLDRMGPYPTREAAEDAIATAKERNKAWDEEDEK
ncbi:SPOR domain-containing protein [Dietzia sp.]|uniref:SPOR domain-containing protein n=1 Tax=Dietzia sp. TaxID=1871616 RepID=UPI002FDA954F